MARLRRVKSLDRNLDQVQSNVAEILEPISAVPLTRGFILSGVVLASGDNHVNHKLGRALTGWFVVRKRAAADIYDKQDVNSSPALDLVLHATAAVTVDLFVF